MGDRVVTRRKAIQMCVQRAPPVAAGTIVTLDMAILFQQAVTEPMTFMLVI